MRVPGEVVSTSSEAGPISPGAQAAVGVAIRVLLADDHAVLRAGLRIMIDGQADMQVLAEAGTAEDAVQLCLDRRPDVVVLDMAMPGGGSLDAIRTIRKTCESCKVLVLTMYDDRSYLRSVLDAGGSGFVAKRAADTALLTAIRAVHEGRSYIDVSLDDQPVPVPPTPMRSRSSELGVLSSREQEVLELVAHGHTNREIAQKLDIGVKSVDTYRSRLSDKLGLKTRAELVRYALEQGLLEPATVNGS